MDENPTFGIQQARSTPDTCPRCRSRVYHLSLIDGPWVQCSSIDCSYIVKKAVYLEHKLVDPSCPCCGKPGEIPSSETGRKYCKACISEIAGVDSNGFRMYTTFVMICEGCGGASPHRTENDDKYLLNLIEQDNVSGWKCQNCGHEHKAQRGELLHLMHVLTEGGRKK